VTSDDWDVPLQATHVQHEVMPGGTQRKIGEAISGGFVGNRGSTGFLTMLFERCTQFVIECVLRTLTLIGFAEIGMARQETCQRKEAARKRLPPAAVIGMVFTRYLVHVRILLHNPLKKTRLVNNISPS
jgi:hypothetical protein